MGRPTTYSQEVADTICEYIATHSKSLKKICEEIGIPVRTVYDWLRDNETFSQQYARAKEDQADLFVDEMLEIADDSSEDLKGRDEYGNPLENKEFINRSRLRVDTRKWIASKLKAKKYGEKQEIEHSGAIDGFTINISKKEDTA